MKEIFLIIIFNYLLLISNCYIYNVMKYLCFYLLKIIFITLDNKKYILILKNNYCNKFQQIRLEIRLEKCIKKYILRNILN